MAHLPYADLSDPDIQPLIERIIAERGSTLHLYQMLLHSPPLAEGWLSFLTAVRQKCSLSGALRELAIMRVAGINGAQYEADVHAPLALAEGITQAQIDALDDWQCSDLFDDTECAVLALTDAMTIDVQVPKALLEDVRSHFDNTEIVELAGAIAAYNMVSRFLEAFDIHYDESRSP